MGIVYVTTHLMMAICITGILYFALKPDMGITRKQKLPVSEGFYARGLKLIVVVATTTYRIAMGILVTYLK